MMSALAKLNRARMQLLATDMKKSGHNKFAGYKYFELGDFLHPIMRIFDGLHLCGVVSFGTDIATLTITDLDDGSEVKITSPMSTAALKGCHEVQNLGAVQTYIRRYLWVAALEIVEHDAIDSSEPVEMPPKATGSALKPSKNVTPISAPKESAKSVTASVFESLPEHEQIELVGIASDVAALSGNPKEALEFLEAQDLDADHKTALWSLLDSRVRAAIKKEKEAA